MVDITKKHIMHVQPSREEGTLAKGARHSLGGP